MNIYRDSTEEEVIEAYTSMMDYSGKVTPDMQAIIDAKGGLEKFRQQMPDAQDGSANMVFGLAWREDAVDRSQASPQFSKKAALQTSACVAHSREPAYLASALFTDF